MTEPIKDDMAISSAPAVTPDDIDAASPIKQVRRARSNSIVDVPYSLWLGTVATTLMAAISLGVNLGVYLLDALLGLQGVAPIMNFETHIKLFELAAIFSTIAVVAHLLRLRLEAMREAAIIVPLPFRTVAVPPISDLTCRFECSCKVTLALEDERPLVGLQSRRDTLRETLNNAFVVAITDPDTRFSRSKMEQTLKVAALHVLGEGVSSVQITEIRQRRLPATPPPQEFDRTIANDESPLDDPATAVS